MEREDCRGLKKNYEYERTVLYIYPRLNWLEEQERRSVFNRAVLSHRSLFDAEKLVKQLLEDGERCERLSLANKKLNIIFTHFSPLDSAVLLYFCGKKVAPLKQYLKRHKVSESTVRRHYKTALRKFSEELDIYGMSYEWFRKNILCFDWGMDVFKKILLGKEIRVKTSDRRKREDFPKIQCVKSS